jgi:hypothetical protein
MMFKHLLTSFRLDLTLPSFLGHLINVLSLSCQIKPLNKLTGQMNTLPSVFCYHRACLLLRVKKIRWLEYLVKLLKKLWTETEETSQRIGLLSNKKQVNCRRDFKIEGAVRNSM